MAAAAAAGAAGAGGAGAAAGKSPELIIAVTLLVTTASVTTSGKVSAMVSLGARWPSLACGTCATSTLPAECEPPLVLEHLLPRPCCERPMHTIHEYHVCDGPPKQGYDITLCPVKQRCLIFGQMTYLS